MYIHVQRQLSTTKKRLWSLLCFRHVHLLVQLKGIAPWELRRELSGWAVDGCGPAEARGSWARAKRCFWGTWPSLRPSWTPGGAGGCRPWLLCRLLTPQDGLWFAPDLLAVWSHLSRVGKATFICCLLEPAGASLAAL